MSFATVLDFFREDVAHPRSRHYTHHTPEGRTSFSTEEFVSRTAALAEALAEHGIESGDRIMLLSDNRPEWHMVDLATLDLGAVDVPIYGTLTPDQIKYQALDSGARVAVAENPEQMAKLLTIRESCPDLELLIQIEGQTARNVTPFDDMVGAGSTNRAEEHFWDRAAKIDPNQLMTLIYTSGTTGDPKGVMLTHDNMVQNVVNSAHRIPVTPDDVALEFLPLCHVLERMVSYIYMWRSTYRAYCSVYHVGDLMTSIRPTLFAGVPRFFEKVQQKIADKVAHSGAVKRALFKWAMDVGREMALAEISGRKVPRSLRRRHGVADRLVLSKVREGMGGKVRFAISGGAELPMHVGEFFHGLGVPVMEGYGLTETSPVIAVNGAEPGDLRLGTVGKPLANLEIKLDSDGELLVRGPSVMQGYWNKPEVTAEVFDEDGFFRTGDIAEVDDDGFLLIIDRKKDLIVTAGGKNVAPQPIESHIKQSPLVESAVLIGDRRPYIVALLVPAFEELERWAEANGIDTTDAEAILDSPETRELFDDVIERANASLARFEQIKDFRILREPLTVENGQLTPTLKVKRRVVEQDFVNLVEEMFEPR
jgi:long-chain acyl-CoA synthetase